MKLKINYKSMNKIKNTPCRKCGGDTRLNWVESDYSRCLTKTCLRCGFSENIESLDGEVKNKI
jgi:hypothetical protein